VALIATLLAFTLWRQVSLCVTGEPQPVGFAGTSLLYYTTIPSDPDFYNLTNKLQFLKPKNPNPQTGNVMRWVIYISFGLAITAWYLASRASAEGSMGVCPGTSDATVGPITVTADVASVRANIPKVRNCLFLPEKRRARMTRCHDAHFFF
jgi:hypothetical protein